MDEGLDLSSDDSNMEEGATGKVKQQGRPGRKKIPEQWTRVISVQQDDLDNLQTYDLGPELLLDAALGASTKQRGRPAAWSPIFWPKHVKKENQDFKIADNRLSEDRLIAYGL